MRLWTGGWYGRLSMHINIFGFIQTPTYIRQSYIHTCHASATFPRIPTYICDIHTGSLWPTTNRTHLHTYSHKYILTQIHAYIQDDCDHIGLNNPPNHSTSTQWLRTNRGSSSVTPDESWFQFCDSGRIVVPVLWLRTNRGSSSVTPDESWFQFWKRSTGSLLGFQFLNIFFSPFFVHML